jgi:hypothetical protein
VANDAVAPDGPVVADDAMLPASTTPGRALRPKTGPALIVIGIVGLITIGGGVLAIAGTGSKASPATSGTNSGGLESENAAPLLRYIADAGQPPDDITSTLVVPAGSRLDTHQLTGTQIGLYEGAIHFSVADAPSHVVTFYKQALSHNGWKVSEVTAAVSGSGTEIYAIRESSDGYDWEVGVDVRAVNGTVSAALAGAAPAPTSGVDLRLIERDDLD